MAAKSECDCCCECRDHLIMALAACLQECALHEQAGKLKAGVPPTAIDWAALWTKLSPVIQAAIAALLQSLLKAPLPTAAPKP